MSRDENSYILGPISGKPDLNRKAFQDAQDYYHKQSPFNIVHTPFDIDEAVEACMDAEKYGSAAVGRPAYKAVMRTLIRRLVDMDRAYALPGWTLSNGALCEVAVCQQVAVPVFMVYTEIEIQHRVGFSLMPRV